MGTSIQYNIKYSKKNTYEEVYLFTPQVRGFITHQGI